MANWRSTVLKQWLCMVAIFLSLILLKKVMITNREKRHNREGPKLHPFINVIIQFTVLPGNSNYDKQRQNEYLEVLEKNLNHPLVEKVHILSEDRRTASVIAHLTSKYHNKIQLVDLGKRMHYKNAFEYVSKNLLMKTCVIMNADCYIGQGFENINQSILRHGTIYALTRHETKAALSRCPVKDFCGPNSTYIGSHDAFVMNLVRPLSVNILRYLDFRPNLAGAENVVIYFLKHFGDFTVKNPCKILRIFHHHCNRKRGERFVDGKRLEKFLKVPKGKAPFSDLG